MIFCAEVVSLKLNIQQYGSLKLNKVIGNNTLINMLGCHVRKIFINGQKAELREYVFVCLIDLLHSFFIFHSLSFLYL